MKRLMCILMAFAIILSISACGSDDITDQVINVVQAEDEHVIAVKKGTPNSYPNTTFEEAFENFFGSPTWKYFKGTKEGPDEDGDGEPDYIEENVDIVEFTGYCTYSDVEVKALIQFTLSEDGETFDATYLSFNDVPQNMLMLSELLVTVFAEEEAYFEEESYSEEFEAREEEIDYAKAYEYPFGELNLDSEYGKYCLWDLNDDGIYELLLGHGENDSDYILDIWTLDSNGEPHGIGCVYGNTGLFVAPDYDGIYSVYGHMGYEMISRITYTDGVVVEEIVSERELAVDEDYYSNEMEIYMADIADISLLEQY